MKGKQPVLLYGAFFLLAAAGGIAVAALRHYHDRLFAITATAVCIAVVLVIVNIVLFGKSSLRFIASLSDRVTTKERESLYLLPAPTVILNAEGTVLWYNKFFLERMLSGQDIFGLPLDSIMELDLEKLYASGDAVIVLHDSTYQVTVTRTAREDAELSTLCFTDITDYATLQETYSNTKPSVLLILIDNYEDVLQDAKESEKAAVYAAIEEMFDRFMTNSTGVFLRLSNERFMAIIEEQHLQTIMRGKFKILDDARKISVGERSGITLSIGVGYNGANLTESEQFAKQALDMCLGRGGDQAAVKTENGFKFFGGVSKAVEKKSRAKTRIIANALLELVHNADRVMIMGHRFGDLDSVGASIGLAGALRHNGCNAAVVVNREQTLANVLISHIGETDPGLFLDIPTALQECNERTLLIVVDTHSKDFVESVDLYQKAKNVVVIDHHRKTVNFIDNALIFYHEPYASSASELVTELIEYIKMDEKLQVAYAEVLLAGIMLDTKNFVMRTGVRTFEAAAYLRKLGADTVAVKRFFASSIETYQRRAALVAEASFYHHCAITVAENESSDIQLVAPQAADELLGITGVLASFVIYHAGGRVNISARSMGAMNVQVVMERLGGGGHQTMAATQLSDVTTAQAKELLLAALREEATY